jgi:hypothetical protein
MLVEISSVSFSCHSHCLFFQHDTFFSMAQPLLDGRVAANAAPAVVAWLYPVNQKGIQHGFVGIRDTETG